MSKIVSRSFLSLAVAMPLAVIASSVSAQALEPAAPIVRPGMFYSGGSLGLMAQTKVSCGGALVCDRPLIGGKLFGGWRLTPGLAVEINQYYLGKSKLEDTTPGVVNSSYVTPTTLFVTERNRGFGVGINWEIETFRELTSHVRLGVARMETEVTRLDKVAGLVNSKEAKVRPYIGVGLSMQLTENLRFQTGIDWLRSPKNNHM
jgi:hypothetical protein